MKVLLASWTWYPVGGDWTYVENVKKLYESQGIEVIPFSTKNEKNIPSEYEDYFIKAYDYKALNKKKSIKSGLNALKNSVISVEALRNLELLLENHEIAFAHLNIIHHWLTPAIIWKLKKHNIPVIWSLHEYKIICPEGSFVSNGSICEKCFNDKFYNCAVNKCKKQSFLASLLASVDAYFYHLGGVYKKVDYFLCPSQFLLEKFIQFGYDKNKLVLSNLCYDIPFLDKKVQEIKQLSIPHKTESQEKYVLYVGRIEKVKGILTLIKAVAETDIVLKIAGTGPALIELTEFVKINGYTNIQFLGFLNKDKVYELTLNSIAVVCPSEWYENYPYSVIESLLMAKPVVGSNIGGIPELVIDGKTGLLFEPGNIVELREKLLELWNDNKYAAYLGKQARQYIFEKVNYNKHWSILERVIEKLVDKQATKMISAKVFN